MLPWSDILDAIEKGVAEWGEQIAVKPEQDT
jgi:hypothetical protein